MRTSTLSIQRLSFAAALLTFAGASTFATPPAPPANIRTVALPAEIFLSWDAVPDAQSYSVFRAGIDRRWAPIASGLTAPRYRDTDFRELPSLYQIAVRNEAGEFAASAEITVSDVGQNIRLLGVNPRPVSDTALTLSWNLTGAGDGLLEIGTDPANYSSVFWNSNLTVRQEFALSNLQPTTTYFYRLTSASSFGDGVTYSSTFTTQPFTEPPPVFIPIPSPGIIVMPLEDTPLRMIVASQTPEGQPLQVQVSSQPLSGTLIEMFPDLVYVPGRAEVPYADFFELTATDGTANYLTRVMIDVRQGYDAPIANDQSLRFDENSGRKFLVSGTTFDVNPPQLQFIMVSAPTNGVLSHPPFESPATFQYIPNTNFAGIDHFTFAATDGIATGNVATVRIRVAPTAVNQTLTVSRYDATLCHLLGNDNIIGGTRFTATTAPLWGTLAWPQPNVTGDFTYRPSYGITNNADQFTYSLTYEGRVTTATVTLNLVPAYSPPVANPASVVTDSNQAVAIKLSGSSFDGALLTYYIVQAPAHGTLSGSAPDLNYTPAAGFTGTDSFLFRVADGRAYSANATVTISVVPPTPPAAPGGLVATAVSSSQIDLAWIDNSQNEESFQVETSNDNKSWKLLAVLPANSTSFSHTRLGGNRTYAYRVRAINSTGASAYSNTSATKTLK